MIKAIKFTVTIFAIISFSCKQQLTENIDVTTIKNEVDQSLVNASSLLVPAAITTNQNNTIAGRPACCKRAPSRFKLNVSE
jgi:hypothetical protein